MLVSMSTPTSASRDRCAQLSAELPGGVLQRDVPQPLGIDQRAVHVPQDGAGPLISAHGRSASSVQPALKYLASGWCGDERVGGLLGVQLQLLGQRRRRCARARSRSTNLVAVVEVRAGAVAQRVAGTAVAELEVRPRRPSGSSAATGAPLGKRELLADAPVPVLGERLGELHADAVHLEVVAVGVRGEQLVREVRDGLAHRHQVQRQHVDLAGRGGLLARAHEVGDAQEPVAVLAGEGEPEPFGRIGQSGLGEHDARRHPRRRPGSSRTPPPRARGCPRC